MEAWKRKEVIGDCTLYLGDCLEVMPTLGKVDAVVTDPPYGIALNPDKSRFSGGHNPSRRGKTSVRKAVAGDDKPFDPSWLLAYGEMQIIWGWNNYPDLLPRGSCLVWLKRNDDAFGSFLSDAELAWMSKGHGIYCRRDLSNNAIAKDRSHPTQKPVGLMEWCMGWVPKPYGVLDPYMGSGTTGVACVKQGRSFIGIEIDPEYFVLIVARN